MKANPTPFIFFKYAHEGPASVGRGRFWVCLGSVGLVLLAWRLLGVAAWLALLMPLIIWLTAPKQLRVGPRYLLCGREIIYFGNVAQLELLAETGRLVLQASNGRLFVIERERFPTNARKAEKIARNKAAKFDKVVRKIVERVRVAAPNARLTGVDF